MSRRGAFVTTCLPAALLAEATAFSRARGATLFMTLETAFAAVLGHWSTQRDFAVGTPVTGANHHLLEDLVGFFVNTLVLRARIPATASFADLVDATRREVLAAHEHQDLPFERLVGELAADQDMSRSPLFQVIFALLEESPILDLPGSKPHRGRSAGAPCDSTWKPCWRGPRRAWRSPAVIAPISSTRRLSRDFSNASRDCFTASCAGPSGRWPPSTCSRPPSGTNCWSNGTRRRPSPSGSYTSSSRDGRHARPTPLRSWARAPP